MGVGIDAVVLLTGLLHGIDVQDCTAQVGKVVPQLVVDLAGYCVPFGHGLPRIHRHVNLGVQPVTQPTRRTAA